MNYDKFVELAKDLPLIDAAVFSTFWPNQKQASVAIARWLQAGKLIQLRRGKYVLPERFRHKRTDMGGIANLLVEPSYLSLHWALSHYQLIPEAAHSFTSVTTSRPVRLQTDIGVFIYRNVSSKFFWGYSQSDTSSPFLLAHPEKALLDFFHLQKGPFPYERLIEYRFQNTELIERARLIQYAQRYGKPKIIKIAGQLTKLFDSLEAEEQR